MKKKLGGEGVSNAFFAVEITLLKVFKQSLDNN
jgi:hypothetical protein